MSRRLVSTAMRTCRLPVVALLAWLAGGCATDGTNSDGFYGEAAYYYDDPWYWNGCCPDRPDQIGPPPPRPEHPIATPPPRPQHPIATPPPARPSPPVARPAPMPRPAVGRGGRR